MLLTLLMLMQPVAMSFAMTGSHTSVHHAGAMGTLQHADHLAVDRRQTLPNEHHHTSADDCCATALCCPAAVTDTRTQNTPAVNATTQFEFRASFQAITLPVEIKPPRNALLS